MLNILSLRTNRPASSFYKPYSEVLEARNLPAASFLALGDLPGGAFDSVAHDVSEDGTTVVGFGTSASGREAFRWTAATGMVGLGDLPGDRFESVALGVSADGSVVVGYGAPNPFTEAFRWTAADGMVGIGFLPGQDISDAQGVSADGTVIVGGASARPFRWTAAGGMTELGDLPGGGTFGEAFAVSADGSVVVGFSTSDSGLEAFRWTQAGGMVGLGSLPASAFTSGAEDVSADGAVVVGVSRSGTGFEAFRWTAETGMVGLGDLPGGRFFSDARAISADGSVIVGVASTDTGSEAFIWDSVHGIRSVRDVLISQGVDLTGWQLLEATGIAADGRTIVGWGTNPSGQRECWIAQLAPSPLAVTIDIKPDDADIAINLNSNGVLAVAVLTTPDFDATTIDTSDLSRIQFGDANGTARVSPLRFAFEDVNHDGFLDLIVFFDMRAIRETGALTADSTLGELTGFTTGGTPFLGTDALRIVGG
jgi:probable HAF family extracellular repeat protein